MVLTTVNRPSNADVRDVADGHVLVLQKGSAESDTIGGNIGVRRGKLSASRSMLSLCREAGFSTSVGNDSYDSKKPGL